MTSNSSYKVTIYCAALFLIFGLILTNNGLAKENSFSATGYWSYNDCDYNVHMVYFTDDGFMEVRLQEKNIFQDTKPNKYILHRDTIVSDSNVFNIIDSKKIMNNKNSKVLVKCDIAVSKNKILRQIKTLMEQEVVQLCSGHDTGHRCPFKVQQAGSKFQATLSQNCKWGFFDEDAKNRKKGARVIFDDKDHLIVYAKTLCD